MEGSFLIYSYVTVTHPLEKPKIAFPPTAQCVFPPHSFSFCQTESNNQEMQEKADEEGGKVVSVHR